MGKTKVNSAPPKVYTGEVMGKSGRRARSFRDIYCRAKRLFVGSPVGACQRTATTMQGEDIVTHHVCYRRDEDHDVCRCACGAEWLSR